MGPEKRGKTFILLEITIRSLMSGCNAIFFQAGDMSESQQLRRLAVYLTKWPAREKYCKGLWIPTLDCLYNQLDTCTRKERECDDGPFAGLDLKEIAFADLVKAAKESEAYYKPCRNCQKMKGAPWLKWQQPFQRPLSWKDAYKAARTFYKKYKRNLKISTHANETLSIHEMNTILNTLERQEGFIPDVIVIDYADILAPDPDMPKEFRHKENKIWQRLRRLSQERHCLVVTATQTDAKSAEKELLGRMDFSEDKRKYAHVTAMYGLNQTDNEKKIGVMRFNEIVIREDDFSVNSQVKVLQRLQIGKPFIGSYF